MAENKFLPKLSQNLLEILDDDEYYDITIEVGNDPNKNDGTLAHIKLPNILPDIFQIIIRYIYGGRISLLEYDILDIIKILVAANELSLQELIPHLQSFLIKNKQNWVEQNFNLIYQMAFENDSFLDLRKFCTELISKYPEKIFSSSDFTSIPEKALISLIQHDNHQMGEVQVWEHVLKWGIAQNPGLSSDPSCYSNDDFKSLKNNLQQCITFIKFTKFTSKEFLNKAYPYKNIIPEELYEDTIKYFLDNPNNKSEPQPIKSSKNIDSIIITTQHAELISKWIDRLEITDELKMKDTNEILGGYNPIKWTTSKNSSNYNSTAKDSFIFSFMNKESIQNHIISRVKNEKYAINNWYNYGPSFGKDLILYGGFQGEVSFRNKTSYCFNKSSYDKQIRNTEEKFSVDEYEVFQIINDN
ncbi:carbohydrate-binding module family 13 protein [Rhizophagus irregularis DAOM 181602=DAOM 197198]|nr:carbohydrate-binding module family 13 protein [Rhizophagus irregularis DAOM 181602=DAOM 197198]